MASSHQQLLLICLSLVVLVKAGLVQLDPPETRIFGDHEIELDQAPWIVSVHRDGVHHYGGSIVNKNWVLSAAHCTYFHPKSVFTLLVGTKSLDEWGRMYGVAEVVNYEKYDGNSSHLYDIGLLKSSTAMEFVPPVKPITLPDSKMKRLPVNTKLTVSCWGLTELVIYPTLLRAVEIPILPFEKCKPTAGS